MDPQCKYLLAASGNGSLPKFSHAEEATVSQLNCGMCAYGDPLLQGNCLPCGHTEPLSRINVPCRHTEPLSKVTVSHVNTQDTLSRVTVSHMDTQDTLSRVTVPRGYTGHSQQGNCPTWIHGTPQQGNCVTWAHRTPQKGNCVPHRYTGLLSRVTPLIEASPEGRESHPHCLNPHSIMRPPFCLDHEKKTLCIRRKESEVFLWSYFNSECKSNILHLNHRAVSKEKEF